MLGRRGQGRVSESVKSGRRPESNPQQLASPLSRQAPLKSCCRPGVGRAPLSGGAGAWGRLPEQAEPPTSQVIKSLGGIVKGLEKSMNSGNLEKITETMGQFERQFENLDLQTAVVDNMMSQQANMTTPEDEVNALMHQVADEYGLETGLAMPAAGTSGVAQATAQHSGAKLIQGLR
eukprot:gene8159-1413_t